MNFARRQILQIAGATVAVGIIGLVVSAAADEGPVTADELRSMCQAVPITQNATAQPPTAEEVTIQKAASACMLSRARSQWGVCHCVRFAKKLSMQVRSRNRRSGR
jgi:hypothetical protein